MLEMLASPMDLSVLLPEEMEVLVGCDWLIILK
jgi:hypothetical protein